MSDQTKATIPKKDKPGVVSNVKLDAQLAFASVVHPSTPKYNNLLTLL